MLQEKYRSFLKKIVKKFNIRLLGAVLVLVFTLAFLGFTVFSFDIFAFYNGDQITFVQSASDDFKIGGSVKAENSSSAAGSADKENSYKRLEGLSLFNANVKVDGKTTVLYLTSGKTVESILKDCGIIIDSDDIVKPDKNTMVTGNTEITVTRNETRTEEVKEELPFEHIRKSTSKLGSGETSVLQKGVPGLKKTVFEVKVKDGVEISRSVKSEEIVKKPVSEIINVGTGGTVTTSTGKTYRYKRVINVKAYAYTTEKTSDKITAMGTTARVGAIAVDPDVIPLGSRLYITALDGKSWAYGIAVAEDTGGAINGRKVDLFFNTEKECFNFGVRSAKVYILE